MRVVQTLDVLLSVSYPGEVVRRDARSKVVSLDRPAKPDHWEKAVPKLVIAQQLVVTVRGEEGVAVSWPPTYITADARSYSRGP